MILTARSALSHNIIRASKEAHYMTLNMTLKNILNSVFEIISSLSVTPKNKTEQICYKLTAINKLKKELEEMEKVCKDILKSRGFDGFVVCYETEQKVSTQDENVRSFDTWKIALEFSKKKEMKKFVELCNIQSGRIDEVLVGDKELLQVIDENTTVTKVNKIMIRKLSKEDLRELKTA